MNVYLIAGSSRGNCNNEKWKRYVLAKNSEDAMAIVLTEYRNRPVFEELEISLAALTGEEYTPKLPKQVSVTKLECIGENVLFTQLGAACESAGDYY